MLVGSLQSLTHAIRRDSLVKAEAAAKNHGGELRR